MIKQKSDLVLLFEYSSGVKIDDYLIEKAQAAWTWQRIVEDMNKHIRRAKMDKMINAGLFEVTKTNISRWYGLIGIKSIVKRGPKPKGEKNGQSNRIRNVDIDNSGNNILHSKRADMLVLQDKRNIRKANKTNRKGIKKNGNK